MSELVSGRLGAREVIDLVVDEGTFCSWDVEPLPVAMTPDYADDLERARVKTGLDESVVTGEGRVRGRRVAVVAGEFAFLAGSIGVAAAERVVRAVERATRERLPVLAAPASGGTRMQEGAIAFVQMVKITAAVAAHKAAGLPYLVYLRHPTTGGVFASWGSLGHVTFAEPGALIGFLGPRVYESLYHQPFPGGVQTAENLYAHGIVDAVVAPPEIAGAVDRVLSVLSADAGRATPPAPAVQAPAAAPAWESVTRSRNPERPGVRQLLRHAASDAVPLRGSGDGEHDPGLMLALARFGDVPCVLIGQDRAGQAAAGPLGPGALRTARRGMRLACDLGLPLLTVIDTAGAALSEEAEQRGLAGEIARCIAEMVTLDAPTLCLLLGEGSGGGALALLPADRVVAAEHAWLSPLPPEGASAIVHRTTAYAPEMAGSQGVRSVDLLRDGVVDRVITEHPDAAEEVEAFCARVGAALRYELASLAGADPALRHNERIQRHRGLGLAT